MADAVGAGRVLLAMALATHERAASSTPHQLAPLVCNAMDDADVFKLATKLIPLLQAQMDDPAILKEVQNIKGTFVLNVTQNGKVAGTWHMQLFGAAKPPVIGEGKPKEKPTLSTTLSDEMLLKLAVGKANPVNSFMSGKIKLAGNIMMAQKLEAMFRNANGYERSRLIAMDFVKDNEYLKSKL